MARPKGTYARRRPYAGPLIAGKAISKPAEPKGESWIGWATTPTPGFNLRTMMQKQQAQGRE